ncbi:phosphatase PAP2 family protein [Pseudonocardia sp. TRM90224]|uniref:phosphatase PAP2 family protein n=1 Tax=Pseudonocardia sp. TRM90224 TaxID=2812678 RepID=UPI001E44768B|nr:phosphatase PAP2 family protein [Pseudonocardia sp. TRM90224]
MTTTSRERTTSPAVPKPMRATLLAMIGLAAVVFTVLAVRYAGDSEPSRFDERAEGVVDAATNDRSRLSRLIISLSPVHMIVLIAIFVVICLALRRWRLAVVALLGPGLTGIATTMLKPLVGRTLEGGFAYPSGHTAAATALGIVTALIVVSLWLPDRFVGVLVVLGFAGLAGSAMAVALVTNNFHYPTDTIGGFCIAVVVVLGVALIVDRIAEMRRGKPVTPA